MNICIISGSPKNNSVTLRYAKSLSKEFTDNPEIINLKDLDLNCCTGCMKCYHAEKCVIRDDLDIILGKIDAADLVVFATPTYLFNVSTLMKIFIDRMANWGYKSPLMGKPSVIVSTADGKGTGDCISLMRRLVYFTGTLDLHPFYCKLYEFKFKGRLLKRKEKSIKKIKQFFKTGIYKPGYEYLHYFNIKKSYLMTAKQRFYEEHEYWKANQAGNRFFYPIKKYKIKLNLLKKIYSIISGTFMFFDYKMMLKYKR